MFSPQKVEEVRQIDFKMFSPDREEVKFKKIAPSELAQESPE